MKNNIIIVMTFYKGQQYFKNQIDSIKKQTKLPNTLIIVNDSPEDKIATQFLHTFNYGNLNVNILDNKKNEGCTKAIYLGLQHAYAIGAKYIFIGDQDDFWCPDKIQLQYEVLKNGADICNHYSQKLIDDKLSSINFANSAGHSLAFNASSFRNGIRLISRPNFISFDNKKLNATYDSILSFIPLMYGLKWGTVNKVLVHHRLYNKEHFTINSEMHRSLIKDLVNLFNGINSYKNMKCYLDQNTTFKTTSLELFNYYRKTINKYDLCDFSIKLKNRIFDVLGMILHK